MFHHLSGIGGGGEDTLAGENFINKKNNKVIDVCLFKSGKFNISVKGIRNFLH